MSEVNGEGDEVNVSRWINRWDFIWKKHSYFMVFRKGDCCFRCRSYCETTSEGELARDVLGSIIFHDESAKYKLNEMIHPLVKQKIVEGIEVARRNGEQLVVLDVPLLFESDFESLADCTLVVYVPRDIQVKRLMKRDGIDEDYALAKINSQMSLEQKRDRADYVLTNERSMSELRTQFEEMFEMLWEKACQTSLD